MEQLFEVACIGQAFILNWWKGGVWQINLDGIYTPRGQPRGSPETMESWTTSSCHIVLLLASRVYTAENYQWHVTVIALPGP